MQWYKAYANLKGHRKRYRLAAKLGISPLEALAYIHLWFSHIAEYASHGDLTGFENKELALACEWSGDPDAFIGALMDVGFIENGRGGKAGSRLIAHDWYKENGRFIKENEKRKPVGNPRKTHGLPVRQDIQDKTDKQEKPGPSSRVFSDLFKASYQTKYGQPPVWADGDFPQLARLLKTAKPSEEEFSKRLKAYFSAKWITGHDLKGFVGMWDKWAAPKAEVRRCAI